MGNSTSLAALARLVDEIPPQLLTLTSADYIMFISSLEAIKDVLELWRSGGATATNWGLTYVPGLPALSPVTLIRQALLKCPDQSPSPTTTALAFIGDSNLRESIRLDISAANHDLAQGEWKGATVLAGSAVEALLLWALQEHEQHNAGARQAAIAALGQSNTLTQNPPANPVDWNLHQYIAVALHLEIIESETATQARQAKDFRNLIHPGRAIRLGQKCNRGTALAALAAVEFVVRDLTP